MAKVDIIQTSFAGGEFGPSLFGRTDIVQYANACEIVENFLPRSYGSVISMPGTRYVATVSDSTLRTRLASFVFNKTDAYQIEMGDLYMRFYTNRGQVVNKVGTEDLSAYSANLKAHWKMNDNVGGTGTTVVLDAVTTHNGTASTVTSSLSTTAIVSTGFDFKGLYHVSVADHADFTRTASAQPMTIAGWYYYSKNVASQTVFSKSGEYELYIDSSDQMYFALSSTPGKTVAANGNAQIDTAQYKFGSASGLFDGTGDSISSADNADWDFGTGDFTIDFWVRWNSLAGTVLFSRNDSTDFRLHYNNVANTLTLNATSNPIKSESWTPSTNTWYHVAVTRSGTNLDFWINGTKLGTTTTDATDLTYSTDLYIGDGAGGGASLNGWIDEFRWSKGVARWNSDFPVPTSAYDPDSFTKLLLHFEGADASTTFTDSTGGAVVSWKVGQPITTGWKFFSIVFNGVGTLSSDCTIYLDGVSVGIIYTSNANFTKMSDTSSLFRIGTNSSTGANIWAGKMDDLAFIHQALTAAQIASLYSSTPYQITTVFKSNEVFEVHYTQLNDVVWLAHKDHPVQKLVRTSSNEWAISDAPIVGGPFLDSNTNTSTTLSLSATQGTVNITAATGKIVFTKSASTLGHHNAFFAIGGLTAETNSTTGLKEVSYVKITHVINSYTATATVIKNVKVTTATSDWAEGAWSAVRGYPSRVTQQERRLWFARTNYEPQKEWASKVFSLEDFALDTQSDDDALNLPLASTESNEIQWLAPGKSLIAGTFGGGFVTNSGSSEPITPDNANASEEIGFGADSIMPKKIGSLLYYVQRFGKKIREMFYNWELDTYKASDKNILSPHILGDGVVDIDVQKNPESILYCVLTNGTLATMTREIDQEVTAWARHSTSGTYTSVAVIPSQTEGYDEAWVIVERWINGSQKKYVEYFENIEVPDRQDLCNYLHSALTYNGYESTNTSSVTISLSASSGSVTLTSSTAYFNGGMINKRLRAINAAGTTIGQGTITATASTTSITLSITTTFTALSYSAGYWGVSVSSVSGLSHLEAKTVGILADGNKESLTRTVASGVVTLGSNYFVVTVGLSYDQIIFTLPKEVATQRGTSQGKFQRFNEISLKLNRSTQDFKYGPDADNLDDANLSFTPTVATLYTGILPPQVGGIGMRGGYDRGAQIYIKNSNPLPMEILSIIGSLGTEEK